MLRLVVVRVNCNSARRYHSANAAIMRGCSPAVARGSGQINPMPVPSVAGVAEVRQHFVFQHSRVPRGACVAVTLLQPLCCIHNGGYTSRVTVT